MLILNQSNVIFFIKDIIELIIPILICVLILVTLLIIIFESKGKGVRDTLSAIADVATIIATGILVNQSAGGSDKNNSEDKNSKKPESKPSPSDSSNTASSSNTNSSSSPSNSPSKSFSVLALLSGVEAGSSLINQFAFFTLFTSLVILSTSINIVLYYSAIYLITKGDYESKYPRLAWIVRRYKNTSSLLIIVSIISFYIATLALIIVSFKIINI